MKSHSIGNEVPSDVDGRGNAVKIRASVKWIDFGLAIIAWGVVEGVLVKLVPVFTDAYDQFGGKLPAPTRFVIRSGGVLDSILIPMVLAGIVAFQLLRIRVLSLPLPGDTNRPWDSKVMSVVILLGALIFLFVAVALYLPIYWIGEVINSR
jgi:type II secretory pathway component PulF